MSIENPSSPDQGKKKIESINLITPERVEVLREDLQKKLNMDLSKISVNISEPGDNYFDQAEIQWKLLYQKCNSNFPAFLDLMRGHGVDVDRMIPWDEWRRVAIEEGIEIDGSMPSFANSVDGEGMINFLAVRKDNIISMAERFALKEGYNMSFEGEAEATEYLSNLCDKIFIHEIGHVAYDRVKDNPNFSQLLKNYPDIIEKVINVQRDRYANEEEIPIADEAFADLFVNCVTDMTSRIGRNDELEKEIKRVIGI